MTFKFPSCFDCLQQMLHDSAYFFFCFRYVPKVSCRNNDKAKQQLQERMSGLKEYPELDKLRLSNKDKHRRHEESLSSNDRIAELLSEIYERIEWLKEMNELGEGKKHRQVIDAEVTERLREIKKIEEKLANEKRDGLQNQRDHHHNHNN